MESKNTLVRAVCQCSTLVRTCLPVACRMYTVCCLSPVHVYPDLCVCACVCVCVCVWTTCLTIHWACVLCVCAKPVRVKNTRVCACVQKYILLIQYSILYDHLIFKYSSTIVLYSTTDSLVLKLTE